VFIKERPVKWVNNTEEIMDWVINNKNEWVSSCCSAKVKDGFCCDCGEQCEEVVCS
jgi:hypothetical protein